jgi:hypothetical protein
MNVLNVSGGFMLNQREKIYSLKKVDVHNIPWLSQCCWSCRNSDVSADLSCIVCKKLNQKVSYNNICSSYQMNPENPYMPNSERSRTYAY